MQFTLLSNIILIIKNKINKAFKKDQEILLTPTEVTTNFVKFK